MAMTAAIGFREFLSRLREAGEIIDIDEPISLVHEIGAICRILSDEDGPAALLNTIDGNASPCHAVAVNLYGPRRRIALAFGADENTLLTYVATRIRERIAPTLVDQSVATCQEIVLTGNEVDLTKWPIPLWNEGDGGPYITSGLWIARHPEFGLNIAHHRGQVYGPREIGVCVAPDHHLRLATDEARAKNERVEAAVIIGARPSLTITASSDLAHGDYEVNLAGALEGQPIQTVKCRTVDIDVPADSEIVIEGYFDGTQRPEGPFVEFTGYQTPVITSPVFVVTAITHRRDPIFHGVFAGVPPCETNTLWREIEEAEAFSVLRRKFPMLKAVHRPPQVGRDFWGVLQIDPSRYREGMTTTLLLASAAVMPRLKYVIAVDDDINLYNLTEVIWAICTRCDPKSDIQLMEGTMTSWLDPSSGGVTGKLFIDATKKKGFRGAMPGFPTPALERAKALRSRASQYRK